MISIKILTGNRYYVLDHGKYAKFIRDNHSSAKVCDSENERWRVTKVDLQYNELFIFDVPDSSIPENLGYRNYRYVDGEFIPVENDAVRLE